MSKFVPFYEKYGQICFDRQKTNNDNDHDHDNNGLFTSHPRSGCLFEKTYLHAMQLEITLTGWALDANYIENNYQNEKNRPWVGLNHQPFG